MYRQTAADKEYEAKRNQFIPAAEMAANRAAGGDAKRNPAKWNRTFFREMTRKCVAAGLIRPENLDIAQ